MDKICKIHPIATPETYDSALVDAIDILECERKLLEESALNRDEITSMDSKTNTHTNAE